MIGWCEAEEEDLDGDRKEVDLYMQRGDRPVDDRFIWLCAVHKP